MHAKDGELLRKLWHGLAAIPNVRIYGPGPDAERTSLVSFTIGDLESAEVSRRLATRGLFLSHGDFYAATVLERYGIEEQGFVRAGISVYTTGEEVERLLEAVGEIAAVA